MALGQRLDIRQSQALVMTPQLQQAIKLLQLSNLELAAFIDAELERNPMLAREETDDERDAREAGPADDGPDRGESDGGPDDFADERLAELRIADDGRAPEADGALDADFDAVHPEADREAGPGAADAGGAVDWSRAGNGAGASGDDEGSALDNARSDKTLAEHLHEQLAMAARDPVERLIGAALIDLADDDGYLRVDLAEVAEKLGADLGRVEATLARCQGFEPTGVLARNLKECLALQLKERDRYDPAMAALVEHLELLAKHDYRALRTVCGVDAEDLEDMIAEIKSLTPKPGAAFGGGASSPIEPDVTVKEGVGGAWTVELNADTLPRVLVDNRYFAEVKGVVRSDAERTFITECHQNASWLVRSLDQRARTILKVATEIVRQQDAFFALGVEHLRPLNLKTVADAVGVHESTVSRVTSNKYMASPRGIFEFKYFFTAAIAAAGGGEAHSAEAVRHRIRALVDAEPADDPLSDDRLVEILRGDGVDIARRTVAKYREALRIPSSVQRRRMGRKAG